MKQALADLKAFHEVFDCARSDKLTLVDDATFDLRMKLIKEEFEELITAMVANDLVEIADAMADLCYVVIGTAVAYGIPFDKVWDEVHRSNMAKAELCSYCTGSPLYRAGTPHACTACKGVGFVVNRRSDGKILKPEGWTPPNIAKVLGLKEIS